MGEKKCVLVSATNILLSGVGPTKASEPLSMI